MKLDRLANLFTFGAPASVFRKLSVQNERPLDELLERVNLFKKRARARASERFVLLIGQ